LPDDIVSRVTKWLDIAFLVDFHRIPCALDLNVKKAARGLKFLVTLFVQAGSFKYFDHEINSVVALGEFAHDPVVWNCTNHGFYSLGIDNVRQASGRHAHTFHVQCIAGPAAMCLGPLRGCGF